MRLRAKDVGLAIVVLALVGAGLHALFGEFAHHSWRAGIRSGNGGARAEDGARTWRGLVVAPEHRCAPYERTDYSYPQSIEAQIVASMGGRVYGPYTGRYFSHTRHTDIEHMVATSEAHDSGLCAANPATRRAFARDLLNLTLAAPEVNRCQKRGKCGKDAGEWLPARNDCWFAARVILVKRRYGLTADRREAQALEQVLSTCSSTQLVFHAAGGNGVAHPLGGPAATPGGSPGAKATAQTPATADALERWDDNRNGRISCAEGKRSATVPERRRKPPQARMNGIAPVSSGHPAYRYMRDTDGSASGKPDADAVVCE